MATYEEEIRQRLSDAAFRRARGAGAVPPTSAVPPVEPKPGALGRMAGTMPTFGRAVTRIARPLAAAARFAAPVASGAAALGAEGLGVLEAATDPGKTKLDVAARGAEGVSRLASAAAGAGIGFAGGGPFGAAVGGTAGYFAPNAIYAARDWWRGDKGVAPVTTVPVAPAAAPTDAFIPPSGAVDAVTMGQNNLRLPSAPSAAPAATPSAGYKPMTAADIRGTVIPRRGTGAFVNNTTGAVTNFAPTPDAPLGAVPEYRPRTYIGALLDMKRGAMTEARAAKVAAAQPALNKANAETEEINIRRDLAAKYLEQNPTDFAGASVVFKGGALPGATYSESLTSMPDKSGAITLLQRSGPGAGTVRKAAPQPATRVATRADFVADVKRMGSKDAVLREYARRNITPPEE